MNNQDYEQKKRECWEEFCKAYPLDATANGGVAFRYAFDCAYALGKQAEIISLEEVVISGWVCRDKYWDKDMFASDLFLAMEKPDRDEEWKSWVHMGAYIPLNSELFPDLTWESEPEPVEIIIKRKKNG